MTRHGCMTMRVMISDLRALTRLKYLGEVTSPSGAGQIRETLGKSDTYCNTHIYIWYVLFQLFVYIHVSV